MKNTSLSPRKPDALDSWKGLCYERSLAHQNNEKERVNFLNDQLKEIRQKGGWNNLEIQGEFEMYDQTLQQPFTPPSGNACILYDLNDDKGNPRGLNLNLHQISLYWTHRKGGLAHDEALRLSI